MKLKGKYILLLIGCMVGFMFMMNVDSYVIGVNQKDLLLQQIMNKYNSSEVMILDEHILYDKPGKYPLYYNVNGYDYSSVVFIEEDAFNVEVIELEIDLGMTVSPLDFIKGDCTGLFVSFEENYPFDQQGYFDVKLCIENDRGMQCIYRTKITILERDEIKPYLNPYMDLFVELNNTVDYFEGIVCFDNQDPQPFIEVTYTTVDLSKVGQYSVEYLVKDRSGNSVLYNRTVHVVTCLLLGNVEPSDEKVVYLTFDDGPSMYTEEVLAILDNYGVEATFFVIGSNTSYLYLLENIESNGHTIGLHSYSHTYEDIYLSVDDYLEDFIKLALYCKDTIGYIPRYMRFPGGSSNLISKNYSEGIMQLLVTKMNELGFQYYDWNVTSGDGNAYEDTDSIIKQSTVADLNNIILLLHDANGKQTTVEALPSIIEYYLEQGYVFKGIDDSSYVYHHQVQN